MHEQSDNGSPETKLLVKNIQCKQANKQYEQDTHNTRRPEQEIYLRYAKIHQTRIHQQHWHLHIELRHIRIGNFCIINGHP